MMSYPNTRSKCNMDKRKKKIVSAEIIRSSSSQESTSNDAYEKTLKVRIHREDVVKNGLRKADDAMWPSTRRGKILHSSCHTLPLAMSEHAYQGMNHGLYNTAKQSHRMIKKNEDADIIKKSSKSRKRCFNLDDVYDKLLAQQIGGCGLIEPKPNGRKVDKVPDLNISQYATNGLKIKDGKFVMPKVSVRLTRLSDDVIKMYMGKATSQSQSDQFYQANNNYERLEQASPLMKEEDITDARREDKVSHETSEMRCEEKPLGHQDTLVDISEARRADEAYGQIKSTGYEDFDDQEKLEDILEEYFDNQGMEVVGGENLNNKDMSDDDQDVLVLSASYNDLRIFPENDNGC